MVQSISRILGVLETLAAANGKLSLTQFQSRFHLPLPTLHRLFETFAERGYVKRRHSLLRTRFPRSSKSPMPQSVMRASILAGSCGLSRTVDRCQLQKQYFRHSPCSVNHLR